MPPPFDLTPIDLSVIPGPHDAPAIGHTHSWSVRGSTSSVASEGSVAGYYDASLTMPLRRTWWHRCSPQTHAKCACVYRNCRALSVILAVWVVLVMVLWIICQGPFLLITRCRLTSQCLPCSELWPPLRLATDHHACHMAPWERSATIATIAPSDRSDRSDRYDRSAHSAHSDRSDRSAHPPWRIVLQLRVAADLEGAAEQLRHFQQLSGPPQVWVVVHPELRQQDQLACRWLATQSQDWTRSVIWHK